MGVIEDGKYEGREGGIEGTHQNERRHSSSSVAAASSCELPPDSEQASEVCLRSCDFRMGSYSSIGPGPSTLLGDSSSDDSGSGCIPANLLE